MLLLFYEHANMPDSETTADTMKITSQKINALMDDLSPSDKTAANQAYLFPMASLSCTTLWEMGCYMRFIEVKSREDTRTLLLELVHRLNRGDLMGETALVDAIMSRIR